MRKNANRSGGVAHSDQLGCILFLGKIKQGNLLVILG